MRTRRLLLLAVAVTLVPVWLEGVAGVAQGGRAPARVSSPPVAGGQRSPEARALAVLRRWDGRRAAAWAAGDPTALARLYVRGSRTGAHDVHDLRRWVRRGLRVTGLHQQVASLLIVGAIAGRASHRTVVIVTDRTVDGVAVGAGRRTAVPASDWGTHRISLLRIGGSWQVGEVRAQPAR